MLEENSSRNLRNTDCEIGDLALFYGRVVEVVETAGVIGVTGGHSWPTVVEHVDAGGVKRRFVLNTNAWCNEGDLRILSKPKDMVLDAILAAAPPDNSPIHQLELRTERWMADPKVGDLFHSDFQFWVLVEDIDSDGVITARETESFDINKGGWSWRTELYGNKVGFRTHFFIDGQPGYKVVAHSSRRTGELPIIPVV